MRFRRSLIVLLSAFALVAASVGAVLAAPAAQTTDDDASLSTSIALRSKAYLGLVVHKLNDHQREALGLPENLEGALVVRAAKDSPAETAGFQRGDVILRANGTDVASPKDLKEVIGGMEPGDELTIVYYRDGRDRVTVTLGERPHRNGGSGGGGEGSPLKNPFQRFLSILPRAVDGSFRALDDEGNVHVYEFAQGSLIETGDSVIAIEKATGETAKFEIGESTMIVKKGHEVELSDLEEGDRVVVLMVDGEVKALVVGPHRRPSPVTRVRPVGPRDADTSMPPEVRERLRQLQERPRNAGGRDRGFGPRIERLEKHVEALHDRLNELIRRLQEQHQQQPEHGPEVTAA